VTRATGRRPAVTPLVNHPERILGIHRIETVPSPRDEEVVVRRMGNWSRSITGDRRKRAADFGLAVIAQLQKT
jgi:hypothetical protein